jgi:hypothetical protein
MRVTGLTFTPALKNANSQAYKNLKNATQTGLTNSLRKKFQNNKITAKVTGFSAGSIVIDYSAEFPPEVPTQTVQQTMSSSAGQAALGALLVDDIKDKAVVQQMSNGNPMRAETVSVAVESVTSTTTPSPATTTTPTKATPTPVPTAITTTLEPISGANPKAMTGVAILALLFSNLNL